MGETKYFVFWDGEQRGPYSAEQLVALGIRPGTYVWSKGMDDWQRADGVEEIRELFRKNITAPSDDLKASRSDAGPMDTPDGNRNSEGDLSASRKTADPREAASENEGKEKKRIRGLRGLDLPTPEEIEAQEDLNSPPQVSMTLAVLSLLLCFVPTGIAAVYFTYKAQKAWERQQKKESHEYERLAKMWLGLTVAFGIIFWTFLFSVKK